jgi:hypothetical protein
MPSVDATVLLVWGAVLHLLVDWLLQNDWQALNKTSLAHPAAWVHAGMHGAVQLLVFPWWAALLIGVTHLLIDTRRPVAWWSRMIHQTQPSGASFDIGAAVRMNVDQVWHVGVIALAALVVAA